MIAMHDSTACYILYLLGYVLVHALVLLFACKNRSPFNKYLYFYSNNNNVHYFILFFFIYFYRFSFELFFRVCVFFSLLFTMCIANETTTRL